MESIPSLKRFYVCWRVFKDEPLGPQTPWTWLLRHPGKLRPRSKHTADWTGTTQLHLHEQDQPPPAARPSPAQVSYAYGCFWPCRERSNVLSEPIPFQNYVYVLVLELCRKVSLLKVISSQSVLDIKLSFSIKIKCHQKMISRLYCQKKIKVQVNVYATFGVRKRGKKNTSVCTHLFLQKDILEKMVHKLMKIKIF